LEIYNEVSYLSSQNYCYCPEHLFLCLAFIIRLYWLWRPPSNPLRLPIKHIDMCGPSSNAHYYGVDISHQSPHAVGRDPDVSLFPFIIRNSLFDIRYSFFPFSLLTSHFSLLIPPCPFASSMLFSAHKGLIDNWEFLLKTPPEYWPLPTGDWKLFFLSTFNRP